MAGSSSGASPASTSQPRSTGSTSSGPGRDEPPPRVIGGRVGATDRGGYGVGLVVRGSAAAGGHRHRLGRHPAPHARMIEPCCRMENPD